MDPQCNLYETIFGKIKMIFTQCIDKVPETVPALSFNGPISFSNGLEESPSDLLTQSLNKLLAISFEI